jgi:hypothetical protein
VRLGLPHLTRATHTPGRDALGERPFDPGTSAVAFLELVRLLSFSGFLKAQILLLRTQAHLASAGLGTGTQRLNSTGFTVGTAELDVDQIVAPVVGDEDPFVAHLALRTGHLLRLPVHRKRRRVEAPTGDRLSFQATGP